jgi:hypothetical protein
MKYSELRPKMKSGDIIASSFLQPMLSSFYAFKVAAVQAFTRSDVSHLAVIWVGPAQRVWIIEAVVPCVRMRLLSQALEEGEDVYHIAIDCDWDKAEDFAFTHIGQPYSQLKAMHAPYQPWVHGKYTECAGMVLDIMRAAGVDLGLFATPQAVLRQALLLNGGVQTLITNPD